MHLYHFSLYLQWQNIFAWKTSRFHAKRIRSENGFTTIELMFLCALMVVFFSLASAKFVIDESERLEYECAYFISDLRYMQKLAMTQDYLHNDFLDIDGKSLPTMYIDEPDTYRIEVDDKCVLSHKLPEGFKMSINSNRIRTIEFFRDGDAKALTVSMELGKEIRYIIIDVAGRIRLSKTPPLPS